MPLKIALAGIGKIARDQHIPALSASTDWELAATVSRHATVEGVEAFGDFDSMLTARPDIEVISLCMPPVPRFAYATAAIRAGRHVMLEKPPAPRCRSAMRLKHWRGEPVWHYMQAGTRGKPRWCRTPRPGSRTSPFAGSW